MDFERAEYVKPQVVDGVVVDRQIVDGQVVDGQIAARGMATFPLALVFAFFAAVAGTIGYALVASLGFMVSIVAIGIAWLIAKAMMTASGGIGGQPYQIAAAIFTYFAVSCGGLLRPLWKLHAQGVPAGVLLNPRVLKYALLGPFLELGNGFNGIIGLLILGIGIRAAWRLAAGSPGFGQPGDTRRLTPFG